MEKSLQDTIANLLKSIDGYSSAELGKAISRLQKAQTKAHKREKEEEERNRILEQEKKNKRCRRQKTLISIRSLLWNFRLTGATFLKMTAVPTAYTQTVFPTDLFCRFQTSATSILNIFPP